MYTYKPPILYSEETRGECISGQHYETFAHSACARRRRVPLGFCSGGFSSTAGYVPGNEAYAEA
jgi:hypothetical protein